MTFLISKLNRVHCFTVRVIVALTYSVVDPDLVGSGSFCRIMDPTPDLSF
jgi:hypothetical protein